MTQDLKDINQQLLQDLMGQVNITSLRQLSQVAQVSRLQLLRIQQGLILNLPLKAIAKIAQALNISIDDLLQTFQQGSLVAESQKPTTSSPQDQSALAAYQQEYQRLQQELLQQRDNLQAEFQQASLETIESWLLQWPTAATAVRQNPQLPAEKLLALVEPIEQLVAQWQVETIATVGQELPYDPQYHELMKGIVQPGELVKVRYVGYKQKDKLLYKAKVSPV
ncbi:MAG: helix-turn-helix domain-containing protein [Cyanobacteria bacterium J06621_8]